MNAVRRASCTILAFLAACATPARPSAMRVVSVAPRPPHGFAIVLDTVTGGRPTNRLGAAYASDEAMAEALRASVVLAGRGGASRDTARLTVSLVGLRGSRFLGHGVKAAARVHYRLVAPGADAPILDSTIVTEAVTPLRRSMWGPTRWRLAVERALHDNFVRFLAAADSLDRGPATVPRSPDPVDTGARAGFARLP